MAGLIRALLAGARDTLQGGFGGVDDDERRARAEQRHAVVEGFLEKRGRLLSMIPLIVILAVASTNMPAAIWTAFSVQLFLNMLDFYRHRYNPKVPFPSIVSLSLLLSYILCIILYYALVPPLSSVYIGCIVISGVTLAMILSLVFMYPFIMQYSAPNVDEAMRNSLVFYRFNQIVTLFWIFMMGCATGCTWASLQFPRDSAGQIILGIVMPIVFPVLAGISTPYLVAWLRSRGDKGKKDEEAADETTNLLETERT